MTIVLFNNLDLYSLLYYFFIYSALGWVMETTLVSVREHRFVNRGFLTGFYCPIYGVGMCSIYILCSLFAKYPFEIFIIGMFFATTLEYFTSWIMEVIFKATWWDYSHLRFNLHGRVCLRISFAWGLLAVVFIQFIHPFIAQLVATIPFRIGSLLLYLIILWVWIDIAFSIYSAFNLKNKFSSIIAIHHELVCILEQSKFYELSDELKKFLDLKKLPLNFMVVFEKAKELLPDTSDNTLLKLHQKITYLREKYLSSLADYKLGEKRLIKAFPQLTIHKLNTLMRKLKIK